MTVSIEEASRNPPERRSVSSRAIQGLAETIRGDVRHDTAPRDMAYDAIVIGGGFIGISLALHLRKTLPRILLIERERDLLTRASFQNQARVHGGYHYPRSYLTGLRCQANFARFANEFAPCVEKSIEAYYAISRWSQVTAGHFRKSCERIGAPLAPAREAWNHFDGNNVEDVFRVREYVFDAVKLRRMLVATLRAAQVTVATGCDALRIRARGRDLFVDVQQGGRRVTFRGRHVTNCTYAGINRLLSNSELPLIPLKYELAELALVKVPKQLHHFGVTVVCGPFFSCIPFPARKLHSLSHVRYTPHLAWTEGDAGTAEEVRSGLAARGFKSRFPHMIQDAQRYVPALAHAQYVDSIWEIKAILPRSDVNDSRPFLFSPDHGGMRNLCCVLGGKLDQVYDILDEFSLERTNSR